VTAASQGGGPNGTVLTVETVPGYIASRPALAGLVAADGMSVTEVGDGNLNLVFICRGSDRRSLVLKQALPYVRLVGPSWPMTEERAAREAAAITAHSAVSSHVCRLIDFDPERHVLALEDLSDHTVLRTYLNTGGDHTGVAERLGGYVADVAFGTSFLALGEEQFRLRAAESINTELCALTEDVVFTEPFLGAERNSVRPDVQPQVDTLQQDAAWLDAALAMKLRFLTVQEALLHGDLHSGSVFVRRGHPAGPGPTTGGEADSTLSVKTFDSEFACYGPIGRTCWPPGCVLWCSTTSIAGDRCCGRLPQAGHPSRRGSGSCGRTAHRPGSTPMPSCGPGRIRSGWTPPASPAARRPAG